jgi:hypothetical protein
MVLSTQPLQYPVYHGKSVTWPIDNTSDHFDLAPMVPYELVSTSPHLGLTDMSRFHLILPQ